MCVLLMIMSVIPLVISGKSDIMGIELHQSLLITIIGYVLQGLFYTIFITIALNEMIRGAH